MTEEEKKAIEKLKSYKELFSKGYCKDCNELCVIDNFPSKDLENNIDIILNLIEKLQKEKEELRHSYDIATTKTEELKKKLGLKQFDVNVVYNDYLEKLREFKSNSIPKNEIRELFAKYNINISEDEITVDGYNDLYFIDELKELLEE